MRACQRQAARLNARSRHHPGRVEAGSASSPRRAGTGLGHRRPECDVLQGVQRGSTATGADEGVRRCTGQDGDLRGCTRVDGLPADGMQEVWGSNPHSSTVAGQGHKFEQTAPWVFALGDTMPVMFLRYGRARFRRSAA